MSKRISVMISLLLLSALILSLCPFAFAEEDGVIHIHTVEELMGLAKDCSLDTWSNGKKVVLESDLSLSASAFDSIPIFNGEFDGGGHTIYDLSLSSAQSPCGFFLETGKEADIHDLNISGTVATVGDDSVVGGLVGLNRGLVSHCSFSGEVSALRTVGGIAGRNEAGGIITASTASGSVRGLNATGGIVGENLGAVIDSVNLAFVNTESVDPTLRLDTVDTSSILNFIRSIRSDNAGITTDTGGIAGFSTGFIERCQNAGAVGYLHLGYNVGGIAGRSNGYIKNCVNGSDVYGRRDVGGIVGQAEPLTKILEAANALSGVSYRLWALNQAIDNAVEDARIAAGDLAWRFDSLSTLLAPVADAVAAMDISDPDSAYYLQGVISDCVYDLTNEVAAIGQDVDGNAAILLTDMDEINSNLSALNGTAIQTIDSLINTDTTTADILVDDSTDVDDDGYTYGKTTHCDNNGSVNGDNNVGGIVGCLSVESELNPESDLTTLTGNRLSKNRLSVYAVILGCVNRGSVTAKNECAGGIAGKMDLGTAAHCASYGPIKLEDGDYAGGICGLLYGTVKSSCTKCSLSGKRYIGGVVGNGYSAAASDKDDRSSLVSGCYTLVEILEKPQFAGAVSGGGAGEYEGNYFVPADYAGLDRLSIQGKAEPIPFEEYMAVEGLPQEAKTFTLRFEADGALIKEVPFAYGASFDRSVFPEVSRRDGAYAVWDRADLSDLRFDTTVTAEYRMDETVLRSEDVRDDGRAIVYVDGQFQQGDQLTLELIPVAEDEIRNFSGTWQDTVREQLNSIFREGEPDYSIPVAVGEHVCVSFPDDGLAQHSVRYLSPNGLTENHRLYLMDENGWQRIHPDTFGSYYLIEVPGQTAEFEIVNTIQSWWIVAYIAAALVVLVLLIIVVVKLRKFLRSRPKKERLPRRERPFNRFLRAHKKPILIILPILLVAAAGVLVPLHFSSLGSALSTYRVLKDFSRQEVDVQTHIQIQAEDRDVELSTTVHRVKESGRMIRCVEQYGIPLYISGGMVCMENGRVFRLAEGTLSQGKVLDLALDVFLHEDIQKSSVDGISRYLAVIGGETADRILQLFLSASDEDLLRAESMTIALDTQEGILRQLSFEGTGTASGGTAFQFAVSLTPREMTERPKIPQAVIDAILSGGGEDDQILSEDLLRLLAAWVKNESAETVSADITVDADCGPLNLSPRYSYSRRTVDGTKVHCVRSALFKLYFTDSAACTAAGLDLSDAQKRVVDTARLIDLAKELCLKGQFSIAGTAERTVYTIALSGTDASDIVSKLLPELSRLNLSYDDCRLRITVLDGGLDSIELDCGGTLRVVSRDIAASVRVAVCFSDKPAEAVPPAVRDVLVK